MLTHNGISFLRPRLVRTCALCLAIIATGCSKSGREGDLKLPESVYGFFLGETKDELFKRAEGVVSITRAPDEPLGYRGELYNFSAALDPHPEVDYVRCAFLDKRLMEVIVYFRNTSHLNLERLKRTFEAAYNAPFVAEDSALEMAQKTYRMSGPGMSITLRRITKVERIELYVQFLHSELHRRLLEKAERAQKAGRR